MVSESENPEIRPVWLVGASFGRTNDQTPRFLRDGMWETATRIATSYSAGTERNTMFVDIDEKIEELRVLRQQVQRTPDWLERSIAGLTRVREQGRPALALHSAGPRRGAGDRGEAIRRERIRHGLTHKELGAKAGLSNVIGSRAETGNRTVSNNAMNQLLDALDLSPRRKPRP